LASSDGGNASKSSLSAPMPGIIDKIFVNVGDEVQPGQSIAVIIAMKMEYVLKVINVSLIEKMFQSFQSFNKKTSIHYFYRLQSVARSSQLLEKLVTISKRA
jgi:acetyl/propionyl-CoA carboxylase alpha subunit